MTKYISKSALLAEIDKLIDKGKYHSEYFCAYRDGNNSALYALKGKIDAHEVKEVDFDEEVKRFTMSKELYETKSVIRTVAKHFFELGLKAQKGE